jgi:hypothetical protein
MALLPKSEKKCLDRLITINQDDVVIPLIMPVTGVLHLKIQSNADEIF